MLYVLSVILLGVWFFSPSTAKHQPKPQLGRQGQELLLFMWEHPNGLGSNSPTC